MTIYIIKKSKWVNLILIIFLSILVFTCEAQAGSDKNNYQNVIKDTLEGINLVLVGVGHPYHKLDDIVLPIIGDSLIRKSPFFTKVEKFYNGQELLKILEKSTLIYKRIGYLAIVGHSGYDGYFVQANSGFHRNTYHISINGKSIPLSNLSANVSDLEKKISERKIIFHSESIIVLVGCNTAFGVENITYDLANIINIPVVGVGQKVDLYNVSNFGEDMKGLEGKSFYSYIPTEDEIIIYDLCRNSATISETITLTKSKVKSLTDNKYLEKK